MPIIRVHQQLRGDAGSRCLGDFCPKSRFLYQKSSFRKKKERKIAKAGKARIKTEITEALVRETHKLVVEQLAKKKSELESYKEIKEAMATNAYKNWTNGDEWKYRNRQNRYFVMVFKSIFRARPISTKKRKSDFGSFFKISLARKMDLKTITKYRFWRFFVFSFIPVRSFFVCIRWHCFFNFSIYL